MTKQGRFVRQVVALAETDSVAEKWAFSEGHGCHHQCYSYSSSHEVHQKEYKFLSEETVKLSLYYYFNPQLSKLSELDCLCGKFEQQVYVFSFILYAPLCFSSNNTIVWPCSCLS